MDELGPSHAGMKWPSPEPNAQILNGDLYRDARGGPGIRYWLLDHYVFILPSPSNCVGAPGIQHYEKRTQLTALVTNDPCDSQLEDPEVALQVVLLQETALILRTPGTRYSTNTWEIVCHNAFGWLRKSSHLHDLESTALSDDWCYITECRTNYPRSLEYDHCVRSLKHLAEDGQWQAQAVTFPEVRSLPSFSPVMPFEPLYEAMERHQESLRDLKYFVSDHPEWSKFRTPEPEDARDAALAQVTTYASSIFSEVRLVRVQFQGESRGAGVQPAKQTGIVERWRAVVESRLLQYPTEGPVDASVTVGIPNFLSALSDEMAASGGGVDATGLLNTTAFFKIWQGMPGEPNSLPLPQDTLHLPVLLITHQHGGTELTNATRNMQRLACTSAASFLAVLGIKDFPVYGLATYGSYGVVSQAWYSAADDCCYAMDGVTLKYQFNLTVEDGVTRFLNFLKKVKHSAQRLRQQFDSIRTDLLKRAHSEDSRAALFWTFYAQLREHDLGGKAEAAETEVDPADDEADEDMAAETRTGWDAD